MCSFPLFQQYGRHLPRAGPWSGCGLEQENAVAGAAMCVEVRCEEPTSERVKDLL